MSLLVRSTLLAVACGGALSPELASAAVRPHPKTTASQIHALASEVAALKRRNAADERELAELRAGLRSVMQMVARNGSPSTHVAAAPRPVRIVAAPLAPPPPLPAPVLRPASGAGPLAAPVPVVGATPRVAMATTSEGAPQPVATRPPATSAISTVYRDQNALFTHGFTMTPTFASAYSDNRFFTLNGFLALGAIFLGNINVSRQQSYVNLLNYGLTYGVTPRFELSANVPYLVRSATYSSVGANGSSSQPSEVSTSYGGIGDSTVGFFYQAATETPSRPNIILNAAATIPTGHSPYGTKLITDPANSNLQYPNQLPTGQGVFGISAGASFVKTVDPMIFFGGLTYYHNLPAHFDDISTDPTTMVPGEAVPGEAIGANAGTAFALNERSNLTFSFQDTIQGESQLRPDGGTWQKVIASGTNAAVFNVGTTYVFNPNTSIQVQLGLGVTQDAPGYQFTVRVPHRF